ncbi:MAG: plastocyanin/azurin family copper-binding protein [Chloroflexota bacterium]
MAVRVVRFSILAGAVLAFAAACGGSGPAATPGGPAATPAPCTGSGGTPVGIAGNAFNPLSISVGVGGVVTWTNADGATHTVTFNDGPDCGRLGQGASVSRTFDTPGTFAYHCEIHASMRATVVVE